MTLRTVSSEQARTEWRTLLDLASKGDVDIVIERHGKATAAVISYETYRALQPALNEIRTGISAQQRGRQMATALEKLAELPARAGMADPTTWQAEQRVDRPLPHSDSAC
ncbi:MAG TPA: type II toxin-antitoxin system Phd/YefM family antitoxin [Anaerolineae bacterium]|nr:type II toxin-antitoxin system Phd/YefM family antitoxin [Anaerolineae bacterium]